jgi:hypothetical protein
MNERAHGVAFTQRLGREPTLRVPLVAAEARRSGTSCPPALANCACRLRSERLWICAGIVPRSRGLCCTFACDLPLDFPVLSAAGGARPMGQLIEAPM